MTWFVIIVCVLVIWLAFRAKRASPQCRAPFDGADSNWKPQIAPQITLTMEVVPPDPAEWEREREEARKAKQSAIDKLRAGFSGPKNFGDALAAMRVTIARFAEAHSSPIPNLDQLWADVQSAGTPSKIELLIRKKLNESYRLRYDKKQLGNDPRRFLLPASFRVIQSPQFRQIVWLNRLLFGVSSSWITTIRFCERRRKDN